MTYFSIHKMSKTAEYRAYNHMRDRCNRKTDSGYMNYGGRGILCLFKSFGEFIDVVGMRPSSSYSLDRIDVNGHYVAVFFNIWFQDLHRPQRSYRNLCRRTQNP